MHGMDHTRCQQYPYGTLQVNHIICKSYQKLSHFASQILDFVTHLGTENEAEHGKYSQHRLERSFQTLSICMGWLTQGANSIHTLQEHHITCEPYQKLTHFASQILVFVTLLAQKMR